MYKNYFKRLIDVLAAFVGLLVLSPVFMIVMVSLYFANQGKPFFFQTRPGKDGRLFRIIKFKTMNDRKDATGNLLPDADRLTKAGSFVRRTSLDEIPQLINVLKGDMSLIGPRPLLVDYMALYNEFEMQRQSVRPGITGLTAVKGRNNISWHQKMHFDVIYVNNITFMGDLKIVIKTIEKVLKREGVNKEGFSSTDSFESYCITNPVRIYDHQ